MLQRTHRRSLGISYAGVVAENAFELLYPFAIGLSVDRLLDDSWAGVVVFLAISLVHTAIAVARQLYGARVFNRLYAELASEVVDHQRRDGVATSTVAARTALAGEYVDFLEQDVPVAIGAAFAVVGSLAMLFLYDPVLGVAAAFLAGPVALLNHRLFRRSRRLYRRLNDQSELEVSLIERGTRDDVRRHFGLLAGHWIRLSDAEAASWGLVDLIAVGLSVFALVRVTGDTAEVGVIFATIAYVWSYIAGFDHVPTVLQRMSNLGDVRRRLEEQALEG